MNPTSAVHDIRPSPIAGTWYSDNPQQLAVSIDAYIARASLPPLSGRLVGVLVPHAGHIYSGPVAGFAFKAVKHYAPDREVVVVIGPFHRHHNSPAVTTAHQAFGTPLGPVPVDHEALEALRGAIAIDALRQDTEHSLEIELPFLQRILGEFRLIPLALVDQSLAMAERLGQALAEILKGQKALLVASSDLSHYHPQPVAEALDHTMLDAVAAFDPARVIGLEEEGKAFACGRGAVAAVMIAARLLGANTAQVVNYGTSGDINHRYHEVVGYGAAVFYETTPPTS